MPPVFRGFGVADGGTGNLGPGLPPGWAADDIFLMFIETANQAVAALTGWADAPNSPQGVGTAGDAAATRLTIRWRRATASETAPIIPDPGDHGVAIIGAVSGCPTEGSPFDEPNGGGGDTEGTPSASVSIPGGATSGPDRLIIVAVANAVDLGNDQVSNWQNNDLTDFGQLININTTQGNGGGFGIASGVKTTAGTYGATTATLANASVQGRISLALRPAGAGATIDTDARISVGGHMGVAAMVERVSAARIAAAARLTARSVVNHVAQARMSARAAFRAAPGVTRIARAAIAVRATIRAAADLAGLLTSHARIAVRSSMTAAALVARSGAARISVRSFLRGLSLVARRGAAGFVARAALRARFFEDTMPISIKVSVSLATRAAVRDAPVDRAKITVSRGG